MPSAKRKENRYWIGAEDPPESRRQIVVSDADAKRMPSRDRTQKRVRVKDLLTGKMVMVRSAPCGLDCFCALEIVERGAK